MMANKQLEEFVERALREDVGSGDHTSLACISPETKGQARLLIKGTGVLAGICPAREVFRQSDPSLTMELFKHDGDRVKPGDIAFIVTGSQQSILKAERLALNILQRMSGIATTTAMYVNAIKGYRAKILDTRKTTPGIRFLEKEAVRIGGGENHRMGLFDMIMIKDNHVDFAGGIENAIARTRDYLRRKRLNLKIEVEARNLKEVEEIIAAGRVDRILLDNFTPAMTAVAVALVNGTAETESSGGITLENIREYAACGVDFISVGALTHHITSLDMSLKAF